MHKNITKTRVSFLVVLGVDFWWILADFGGAFGPEFETILVCSVLFVVCCVLCVVCSVLVWFGCVF